MARQDELQPPPIRTFEVHPPLSEGGRRCLRTLVENSNTALAREAARYPESIYARTEPLTEADFEYYCDAVVNFHCDDEWPLPDGRRGYGVFGTPAPLAEVHELEPVQFIRLLVVSGVLNNRYVQPMAVDVINGYRKRSGWELTLAEFAAILELIGMSADMVANAYLDSYIWFSAPFRWEPEATWPYFASRLEAIARSLDGKASQERGPYVVELGDVKMDLRKHDETHMAYRVENAFDVLDCFPSIPAPLESKLWEMALGSAKTRRPRAQRLLQKEPDTLARVLEELRSNRAERRLFAAQWLGEWAVVEAIPALRNALTQEKQAGVQDALMGALEALGEPLEDIIRPRDVNETARRYMDRKGFPDSLAWLPVDQLPTVRWASSTRQVAVETVAWWMIQANQMKTPEPGALLRRQLGLLRPEDRLKLAEAVLEAWIAFDTMPKTLEQATARAKQIHETLAAADRAFPGGGIVVPSFELILQDVQQLPAGSAIQSKGLLAIAACGDEQTARLASDYVKKWYGLRAAQSKALVQMLAWIDDASSVQFLTATAKNFRTAGIRAEAHKALQTMAERRGWTVDQLADRMVPDGGMDSDGRLELEFGSRRLVAELDPGYRLQVRGEDGKLYRDLPKAAKQDDEELAKESRQMFSKAKREVRTVVKEQTERLFAAMCLEREWGMEDWRRDLLEHPIVGRLCRRTVWSAKSDSDVVLFRPSLGLLDAAGQDVKPASNAKITIAHDATTPPELAAPWLEHFADYALEPLFPQFNRGLPSAEELDLTASVIEDFRGCSIDRNVLRGLTTKLGYRKGETIDGPTFYDYRKSFPTMRLEVRIEIAGQDVGDYVGAVEVDALTFYQTPELTGSDRGPRQMRLAEVPTILLLESYRDYRTIAEAGA